MNPVPVIVYVEPAGTGFGETLRVTEGVPVVPPPPLLPPLAASAGPALRIATASASEAAAPTKTRCDRFSLPPPTSTRFEQGSITGRRYGPACSASIAPLRVRMRTSCAEGKIPGVPPDRIVMNSPGLATSVARPKRMQHHLHSVGGGLAA